MQGLVLQENLSTIGVSGLAQWLRSLLRAKLPLKGVTREYKHHHQSTQLKVAAAFSMKRTQEVCTATISKIKERFFHNKFVDTGLGP